MTRPVRLGLTLWTVLAVVVSVRVLVQQPGRASVVPIYLKAGEVWRSGGDLYAPTGLDVYRYPPLFAAAFAPLTHLPETLVGVGWRLLGVGVLVVGLLRLGRAAGLAPADTGWLLGLAALLSLAAVNNGQVNTLLAGTAVNGTAEALRRRWWRAAGWFAVGGWVKVYPLAVGLLAMMARPRLGLPLAAVAVAGFLLPFAVADREYVAGQYRRMVEVTRGEDRSDAPPDRRPRDWTVIPWTYLGRTVGGGERLIVSLAVAAGLALVVAWRRDPLLALPLGCGWMTAFGPATEGNTYAVLAGPAAWACVAPGPEWVRWVGRVGCGLLAAAVLRGAVPAVGDFELLGVQPVGAVLIMAAGVGLYRQGTMRA